MSMKISGKLFRFVIKMVFVFGSLVYFLGGMYKNDLSLGLFEHCFRFLIILCFVAKFSVFAVSKTTEVSSRIKRMIIVIAVCVLSWIAAELFYTYIFRKLLIILGYFIGLVLVLGGASLMAASTAHSAAMVSSTLSGFSSQELKNMIHDGRLNADRYSDEHIKDALASRGIDYDLERKVRF